MKDDQKTKEELLEELDGLSRKVSELAGARDDSFGPGQGLIDGDLKYAALIENLPQKIFLKDAGSVYVSCNRNFARDLKISPAQIAGKTDYDFFPRELADKYRQDDRRIMDSGRTEEIAERYVRDAGEVHVQTVKTPLKNEKGEAVGILGIFWEVDRRDLGPEGSITSPQQMERHAAHWTSELLKANELLKVEIEERKRVEEALTESEATLRSILASAPTGIGLVKDRVLLWVNGQMEIMLGYSREELVGRSARMLYESDGEFERIGEVKYGEIDKTGIGEVETRWVCKDRSTLDILLRSTAIDPGDISQGVIFSALDITGRKRAEEALRDSMKKLEFFAGSVMHDLKSPATSIHGLARILKRQYGEVLDEKGRNYCEQISRVSEHIAELVEDINVFISTRQTPLRIEMVDVSDILDSVREEFSEQLAERDIEWLQFRDMPGIYGDKLSIHRVFRNFVDNALKYGGDELSEIRIDYEDSERFHIFSVADDGAGIKGEDADRLFGPLHRQTGLSEGGGTGLGLAIVKEVAEQHRGTVWAETEESEGTTFYFSLSKDMAHHAEDE